MRLFARLVVVAACVGAATFIITEAQAVTGAALGASFPGSQVSSSATPNGCGERYEFSSKSALAPVEKFYLDEGTSAGLMLLKDTDAGDPSYRMISFIRPHAHEVLFVTLTETSKGTSGTVYYAPANRQQCS